jgi:hypothetical protein
MDDFEEAISNCTEEQKQKLRELRIKYEKKAAVLGAKTGIAFFVMNSTVVVLNALCVNSSSFLACGIAINTIFLFRMSVRSMREFASNARAEVRSILDNKQ